MSTYHLSVKIISRATGRSSVGAAAYRAGEKITNERDGITHDYTRKGGVEYSEILLPENAPIAYSERALLWNEIERVEKRVDARTAREIEVALPRELNTEEQAQMLREYITENFVSRGMIADFAIHNKDKGNNNPHAHIMLTTRNVTPEGFTGKNRDWNQKENVEVWRENWAQAYNREMQKKSLPDRVDHRSYERQGIDREPTIHKGPAAHHMEMRGMETERGNINRGIDTRNQTYAIKITELREDADAFIAEQDSPLPYAREEFEVYGIELTGDKQGNTIFNYQGKTHIGYVEPQERELVRAMAEPPPARMEPDSLKAKEEPPKEYIAEQQGEAEAIPHLQSREEVNAWPEPENRDKEPQGEREATSASHEPQGRDIPQIEQEKNRERSQATPERENGPKGAQREPEGERPRQFTKTQQRGDMVAERGPALPLYDRAVLEMRKCEQIDNIGGMERALKTIQREGITSYGDYDRHIGDIRQEISQVNTKIKPLTEEIQATKETIGTLEIYEKYLPFRQEIERAGIFQRGKLEKKYKLEMQGFEGCERRLKEWGIDPHNTTAKNQKERVVELQGERITLQRNREKLAQKSLDVKESQKMMKQLFIDHGIDYEMRSREINRALDRGMDR